MEGKTLEELLRDEEANKRKCPKFGRYVYLAQLDTSVVDKANSKIIKQVI